LTVPLAVVSESIAADIRDDLIAMINEHEAVIDQLRALLRDLPRTLGPDRRRLDPSHPDRVARSRA